jgi:uncharacterized protein (DUF697 family)
LRKELARGGDPSAIVDGSSLDDVLALVYVLAGPPGEEDERALRRADRARVPVVCLYAGREALVDVPYVLATDVVRVGAGQGFPIGELAEALARKLGERGTTLAARLPGLRPAVCAELIRSFSLRNGMVAAAVFVPGVDLPVLTLNQLRLVLRIAAAYGDSIDAERVPELTGVVGGALGLRALARELLDLVPGAGWLVKGLVAYGGTRAIGEAAVRYFEARHAAAGSQ